MKPIQVDLRAIIKQEGLRYTHQREAVWLELKTSEGHRDAESIYFALRQQGINISRATVYRTIEILVKNNLIRKLDVGDGKSRFECKQGYAHHDHLICTKCGRIDEFYHEGVEQIQEEIAAQYNYELVNHIHQIIGLCPDCQTDEDD